MSYLQTESPTENKVKKKVTFFGILKDHLAPKKKTPKGFSDPKPGAATTMFIGNPASDPNARVEKKPKPQPQPQIQPVTSPDDFFKGPG
jgi:hypothetical protein